MGGCCSRDDVAKEGLGSKGEEEDDDEFYDGGGVEADARVKEDGKRVRLEGSCGFASMYTQQGLKGVNQDAMVLWEDFGGKKGSVFCGVFDGHGPFGHKVAGHVRDNLPSKLSSHLEALASTENPEADSDHSFYKDKSVEFNGTTESYETNKNEHGKWLSSWKHIFTNTFEELDYELSVNTGIDCICSGTTAVSVVKLRENLLVANLGDSRAILGRRDEKNKLVPVQLTVDLKPNLPNEAERINSCKGRVFALKEEPDVHRIWLPDDDCPGLAMARAFGDFCLKDYGLISTPELSSWKLTEKDEFVVLATDGLWDVLSNKQVVKTVSCSKNRADAAKLLVHRAVRTWRTRYPTSKVDDCAVICLFLKHPCLSPHSSFNRGSRTAKSRELSSAESFKTARSSEETPEAAKAFVGANREDWTALEGISRVNSLVRIPRFASVLSWRRSAMKIEEQNLGEGKKLDEHC
ncbi:probable protein phosphatase 2C 73 [Phalaenopsis equestris]|uniref:probable protein phosphatase 2C 73 n=1 Tax=Phalaenopsis equestris TaxID=78828 RepID=UPI0009E213AF|nr:probable protein phosphatase 2C 73 [Phalaenopsis equestris]